MLLDANGRPIQASESDGSQNQEDSQTADQTADDKQSPSSSKPPIKVIVESSDADSKQHKTEYRYSYALQREAVQVQWYVLIATIAAFGAAAYYAWTAKETLNEIHLQNVAQQRADFSVSINESYTRPDRLTIDIVNKGHVSGTLISYGIIYNQDISHRAKLTRERTTTVKETIIPGSVYILGISLPPIPMYTLGTKDFWNITAASYLTYEDGFGNQSVLRACYEFEPVTRRWSSSCGWVNTVDLSTDTNEKTRNRQNADLLRIQRTRCWISEVYLYHFRVSSTAYAASHLTR